MKLVTLDDIPAITHRGAEIRVLLSPRTVGATSGLMGVARMAPGETIREHYHPYSEEFVYVVSGCVVARLDGKPADLVAGQALLIPKDTRHRFVNGSDADVQLVFSLAPLAPRPELGHVDTE